LKRYELSYDKLAVFPGWQPQPDSFVKQQIEIETKYEGYIKRQFDAVKKLKEQEKKKLPPDFDYDCVPGLSNELKAKLTKIAPQTLGQMEQHSRHDGRGDFGCVDYDEEAGTLWQL